MSLEDKPKRPPLIDRARQKTSHVKQRIISTEVLMNLIAGLAAGLISGLIAYLVTWYQEKEVPSADTPAEPIAQAMQITGLGVVVILLAFAALSWLWLGNSGGKNGTPGSSPANKYFMLEISKIYLNGAVFSWSALIGIISVISFAMSRWDVFFYLLVVSAGFIVVMGAIYFTAKQVNERFWLWYTVRIGAAILVSWSALHLLGEFAKITQG